MKTARLFLVLFLFLGPAFSVRGAEKIPAVVTDVSERAFFPAARGEIQGAKESILVAMYTFLVFPDSPRASSAMQLLGELIKAHGRGVRVRVILGAPFRWMPGQQGKERDTRNDTAMEMLSEGGVDVRYARESTTMHGKMIIIDGAVVILGSHNLTDAALNKNHEFSVLIRSEEFAARMTERAEGIDLRAAVSRPEGKVVRVPKRFLTDRKLAPTMWTHHAEKVFDLFLLLWKAYMENGSSGRRELSLDFQAAAEELGIQDGEMFRCRESIRRWLGILRDGYGLIEFSAPAADSFSFRMARGGLKRPREGTGLPVPAGYWEYGWCRTLTMRAKMAYLICLAERQESPTSPSWSISLRDIADKYANAKYFDNISHAMCELESHDILRIDRDWNEFGQPFSRKHPSIYRLEPLLAPEEIEKGWKALEGEYGREKVKDARRLAAMLDRPNSRETAAGFLRCIAAYGLEATERETKDVAKLSRQNPYRCVGTVIYRLNAR